MSFAQRLAYASAVETQRAFESHAQVAALRRGMQSLLPDTVWSLLTGAELER